MVGGNGRFELCPRSLFTNAVHFVNRARAIPDIHRVRIVKGDAGGDSQVFRKGNSFFEGGDAVDSAVHAAANEHLSSAVEGNAGGIRDIARELRQLTAEIDAEKCDRQLLAAHVQFSSPKGFSSYDGL